MKLSIIVPVYNMGEGGKLQYCLDSLVNQTITDYEIIAVDDYSMDNSREILKEYHNRFEDKIQVIFLPENRRQGGAKNAGLAAARGEWIGFIDSDDWVTADFYEKMLKRAEETGADMVGCDYNLTYQHSMQVGQVVPNNKASQTGLLNREKYRSLIVDGGSLVVKIYKREIILDYPNRFPEHIFYEDNAISNSWMLRARHFEYIPEPMYYYYQHSSSTVHTITRQRCLDRMKAARIMIQEAREFGHLEDYYPEIEFSFSVLFYVNTLFSYMVGINKTEYQFVKALGREMKETFPGFMENPYYLERIHPEEKKLVAMQMRNTSFFIAYYKLLWGYRKMRKRLAAAKTKNISNQYPEKKKAALIGAGSESFHTIQKAKELGLTVIAIDGNPQAPGRVWADTFREADLNDKEAVRRIVQEEQVDFILTAPIGRVLATTGAVNSALHLVGITEEAAQLCTDKYLFHERLAAQGLRNCRCYLAGQEADGLCYPAILKPRFGSGSSGIYFLENQQELERARQQTAGEAAEYILEEAVSGTEYGVDGVVDGREFQMVLLRRKLLTPLPARQAVGYLAVVPEEEDHLYQQVSRHLGQAVQALGLRDCLFHGDLMIEGSNIFIIELSPRPSGHQLHDIFTPLATGVDMAEAYIKCRLGQAYSFVPRQVKKMMIHYFDLQGRVERVPGEAEVAAAAAEAGAELCRWECNISPGEILSAVTTGHSLMGRGYFILAGPQEEKLRQAAELIKSRMVRKG